MNVYLDTESYFDDEVSVEKLCMKSYMQKSYAYLVSIVADGFEWAGTFEELRQRPDIVNWLADPSVNLWAANSNFDQEWTEKYIPELVGKEWQCLLDYAAYHQRPRTVAGVYRALTGKHLDKAQRSAMKGVHPFNHPGEFNFVSSVVLDQMRDYNLTDSRVNKEIHAGLDALGVMSEMETKVAAHTRLLQRRGVAIDEELAAKFKEDFSRIAFEEQKNLPWSESTDKLLAAAHFEAWCCQMGVAPPMNLRKTDDDFTAWMQMNPNLAPVLLARQRYQRANNKLKHLATIANRSVDGIFYPDIRYCGAPHTRRFSSKGGDEDGDRNGFNIQNMERLPVFGDIMPDFFSPLAPVKRGAALPGYFMRNLFVPRAGKKFVILDFSQIEPRVLHWLVGDREWLDSIRQGFNPYETLARRTSGWDGAPGTLSKTDPALYSLSKAQELALGYQCSWAKFIVMAKIYMDGKLLSEDESKKATFGWRDHNQLIVNFWADSQKLVEGSYQDGSDIEVTMPNGETYRRFNTRMLPREFVYRNNDGTENRVMRNEYWCEKIYGIPDTKPTYGGLVVENVVQRTARDLLAEALIRCEEAGLHGCFHAHDEAILEVDADNAQDALGEAKRLFTQVPEWATGIPIAVSGGLYDRYTKD